jgi:hypothetical protein
MDENTEQEEKQKQVNGQPQQESQKNKQKTVGGLKFALKLLLLLSPVIIHGVYLLFMRCIGYIVSPVPFIGAMSALLTSIVFYIVAAVKTDKWATKLFLSVFLMTGIIGLMIPGFFGYDEIVGLI